MSRKQFDRFMVANDNGRNLKWARFTDGEFRALIQGILPIASMANPRGAFMVGGQPATADDVVFLAPKVTKRVAQRAIDRMRELGMLEQDDELGGEWIHDWDLLNPAPKSDRTNAERQRRFRERRNAKRNGVTGSVTHEEVTPPEVKKRKKEEPPRPPQGGNATTVSLFPEGADSGRQRDIAAATDAQHEWASNHFADADPRGVVACASFALTHGWDPASGPEGLRSWAARAGGQWAVLLSGREVAA